MLLLDRQGTDEQSLFLAGIPLRDTSTKFMSNVLSACLINGYPLNEQSSLAGNLSHDSCTVS